MHSKELTSIETATAKITQNQFAPVNFLLFCPEHDIIKAY